MRPYGLVLAGGGAKGAYQIGAWKAMREIGITFEAVAGASIGAINGALIAQGDFDRALDLWNNVEVKDGVNFKSELKAPENLFSLSNFPQIFHELLKNGGVDTTPARDLLSKYIDESLVRASGIPVGLVTFQLSSMKPVELFLEELDNGRLIEYLMLSARFPGLQNESADGERYLDGGVYDNAPIGLLRQRGINRFIVVDIGNRKGIGHKEDYSCADVIYIRPNDTRDLGEAFEFDKSKTEERMTMGYLDTRKAFGYLKGQLYYFQPKAYREMQKLYGFRACAQLEELAQKCEVPRLQVYTERRFMHALCKAIQTPDPSQEAAPSEWVELAGKIVKKARPLLEKAAPELRRKMRSAYKKEPEFPLAYAALDAYYHAHHPEDVQKSDT